LKNVFTLLLILSTTQVFALEKLKYIGDVNIKTGEMFKETELGGLSGIVFDQKAKKILAISDDRSQKNPARFYEFDLDISEKSFNVKPANVITLKDENNLDFKKNDIDFEGITLLNDAIYISSEGSLKNSKPILPALFKFDRSGKKIASLEIPSKFLPSTDIKQVSFGSRDNLVFEALGSLPGKNFIFMGTEEALLQDGSVSTPTYASKTRIIIYKDEKVFKEVLYPLDQVPAVSVAGLSVGETGLVDFAVIDENSTYTLERAFLPLVKKTFIKIFKVTGINEATDISSMDSVAKNKDIKLINKELILSMDDIIKSFSEGFKTTDNIEGICFGPTLPNGHQTLIVVADNNFSGIQRTQFLAFEILP
jgi:hypothetical protein